MTRGLPGLAAPAGAAAVTGLLLAAVFPPLGWSGLAFVAWTPLILAQFLAREGERWPRSLGAISIGVFVGLLALSVNPPEVVTGPAWLGISLVVGLLGGAIALTFALPGQTPRLHRRLRGWGFIWMPALTWTGVEYLRLVTTAGHQWGMTATAQIEVAPLRAFLPLAGMWPVTAITVATNYAIAGLVLLLLRRADGTQGALITGIGTVAAAWVLGVALAAGSSTPPGATIRVAAVQTGEHVPAHPLTEPLITSVQYPELTDVITGIHTPGTVAAAVGGARLIVWPEASGWVDPSDQSAADQIERVRELARAADATIVWPYFIRIDRNRTRNELVLVNAEGQVSSPTTKDHPVWTIGERSVTSGMHPLYEVDGVLLGLAAGPDGTYTNTLARLARAGARLVAIPTHDWQAFTRVHLAQLRTRAAEHRIAVVKADWRYGSAAIGPDGEIIAETPAERAQPGVIVADLPLARSGTPYSASGDWVGVAALVVTALAGVWSLRSALSRSQASERDHVDGNFDSPGEG